jgi:hypothetical protein
MQMSPNWQGLSSSEMGAGDIRAQVHQLPFPLGHRPNLHLSMSTFGTVFPSRHSGLETWSVPGRDILNISFVQMFIVCCLLLSSCFNWSFQSVEAGSFVFLIDLI